MPYKTCTNCHTEKELTDFPISSRTKDGKRTHCKECHNEKKRNRAHQKGVLSRQEYRIYMNLQKEQNKENAKQLEQKRYQRGIQRRHQKKLELINLLDGKCVRCGLEPSSKWPVTCFEFHHTDPSEKETHIANFINRGQWTKALNEIKKCTVLCANCHRVEHFKNV